MAALSPWVWFVGFAGLVAMVFFFPSPILMLILLLGGLESWRRWKARNTPEGRAYHRVPTRTRVLVAAIYLVADRRARGRRLGDPPRRAGSGRLALYERQLVPDLASGRCGACRGPRSRSSIDSKPSWRSR